ncbi:MAG: DUF3417 domain-containing protein, partial [Muribaculaceae bacterium]|nr:DUF3417 domain-containing protein [Muribaculaceae bacterium]
ASGTSGEKAEMNGVLNFSVLDGWWYEGYKFDEKAGWALTDKRTYTDQGQQDKLDAATIYSMLENEIIPLYFAKNSKGYSPEWVQYIKNSIGHIAPNFTMTRMINDYIDRFYTKEARRFSSLAANDYALAREIAAWKDKVASKWDGIEVISVDDSNSNNAIAATGSDHDATVVLNTNGLAGDLGVEAVAFKTVDGKEEFEEAIELTPVKTDGDVVTYQLKHKLNNPGLYRYSFRIFPKNAALAHRQDFAWVRWI